MKKIILLLCLLVPFHAYADDKPLSVKQLCAKMADLQSNGDADYVPNKDVHGRAVAPADLDSGSPPVNLSDTVTVAIGTDTLRQLNLPSNIPYTPYTNLGNVTVKKDGSVYFNGQRLTQPQRQGLCNDKPATPPNASDAGQSPSSSDQKLPSSPSVSQ
jgi:hypothetical protein